MAAEAVLPRISLVILSHRRPRPLRRCLRSLPAEAPGCEGLLVLNGADARTARRLGAIAARRWPWLRVLAVPEQPRGAARNRAVRETRGELLFFLDDDTFLPEGFLERLREAAARHPDAPALGGPNYGVPGGSPFQRAVDAALRSPLAAGPMRARYAPVGAERRAPAWTLMLCGLGVRREVFERHGLRFPDGCASAEENLLLSRVERLLGRPAYCPSLHLFHERRADAASFGEQVLRSGRGRAQITRLDPRSWLTVTAAPLLFAAYCLALPRLVRLWPASAAPAAAYAAAVLVETLRLARRDPAAAARLPALIPWAHACYAAGMARGVVEALVGEPSAAALSGESPASP